MFVIYLPFLEGGMPGIENFDLFTAGLLFNRYF